MERGSEQPLDGRCGAQLRGTDPPRYCCKHPVRGERRCRLHGGITRRGADSPAFRHGRFSRFLPERLDERLDAVLDQEFESMRDHIALLDARIAELLESLSDADVDEAAVWAEILATTECRRRATDAEIRLRERLRLFVPIEQVRAMVHALADAVRLHVSDPNVLRAVRAAFLEVMERERTAVSDGKPRHGS